MKTIVYACVVLALLAAGCASDSGQPGPREPAASAPKRPGTDTLCFNDCLGNGGTKELCESRCSY